MRNHRKRKSKHMLAAMTIMGTSVFVSIAPSAAQNYSPAEIAFINWYEASEVNQKYYQWVVFMQNPSNADWFKWKTQPQISTSAHQTAKSPQQIVNEVFGSQAAKARAIVNCESQWDTRAVSPTNDHGLFQINKPTWNKPGHHDYPAHYAGTHWQNVYDPYTNAMMAKNIVAKYGWDMWACN